MHFTDLELPALVQMPSNCKELPPQPKPQPVRHIRFGALPKSQRSSESTPPVLDLTAPAHGTIARRRVSTIDKRRTAYFTRWTQFEWQRHPEWRPTVFQEVRWTVDVHPGTRVVPDFGEDGKVSPRTMPKVPNMMFMSGPEMRETLAADERRRARRRTLRPKSPYPRAKTSLGMCAVQ